ncbi:phosphatase inhibitor-domain-containing protein [Russula vinacea]|nr:phosphatase inhibitor-domain-containing protein [Russula vinacea]
MALAQSGPSSSMSREGSRTALVVQNAAEQRDASALTSLDGALAPPAGTLRLRGGPRDGPRVAWDEAVVDNEGLGRKKSKICCIYHRPRRFDESSDEDSSGTESGSDDDDTARPSGQYRRHRHHHHRHHEDGEREGDELGHKSLGDRDERNAYERTSPRKGKGKAN